MERRKLKKDYPEKGNSEKYKSDGKQKWKRTILKRKICKGQI